METGTKYRRLKVEKKKKEIGIYSVFDFNASDTTTIIDVRNWNRSVFSTKDFWIFRSKTFPFWVLSCLKHFGYYASLWVFKMSNLYPHFSSTTDVCKDISDQHFLRRTMASYREKDIFTKQKGCWFFLRYLRSIFLIESLAHLSELKL